MEVGLIIFSAWAKPVPPCGLTALLLHGTADCSKIPNLVRRLCGHCLGGPTGVRAYSCARPRSRLPCHRYWHASLVISPKKSSTYG